MYTIPIKVEGIERRKRSTGLLHVIAGLFLMMSAGTYYRQLGCQNLPLVFVFYLVAILSLIYGIFRKRLDPYARFNHWMRMLQFLMFSLLGIFMLKSKTEYHTISLFFWAAASIPLLFTERKIFHDAALSLNKSSVIIPGYFSNKVIPWAFIHSIVVRPDYVTVHYPGNKYAQYEVVNELAGSQIEEINLFCQQQMKEAGKNN